MYHRIDTVDTDPWGICVAPHLFEKQIQYFSSHYPVISVEEAIQQLYTDSIHEHSICITFDDGYADNFIHAKPILEKYNCPATFFIPTDFMDTAKPFWWDELEHIFLHLKQLPGHLSLCINGQEKHYTINDNSLTTIQWQQHLNWKWYDNQPTDRCSVFLAVWESLLPLSQPDIQQHLAILSGWAGSIAPANFRLPMNRQQLQSLFSNPLFTAGLHTHTHPDLSAKEKPVQLEEIAQCKRILQNEYNLDSCCLAYPYGRYNGDTLEAVTKLNLSACFTTEATAICRDANPTQLGRYQVGNWNTDELKKLLDV